MMSPSIEKTERCTVMPPRGFIANQTTRGIEKEPPNHPLFRASPKVRGVRKIVCHLCCRNAFTKLNSLLRANLGVP